MEAFFQYELKDFTRYGMEHNVFLILLLLSCTVLPWYAKKYWNTSQQIWGSRVIALIVFAGVVLYPFMFVYLGEFDPALHLPFHLCNFMAVIIPFIMWNPKYKPYEVLYFYIIAGTLQALLTPDLRSGFPSFAYFKYFIVHAGLVAYIIYITTVFEFRPTLKSIWKAFLWAQPYFLMALAVNYIIGGDDVNYAYANFKPRAGSLMDHFGEWPIYIFVTQVVGVIMFLIIYIPFIFIGKGKKEIDYNAK